MNQYKHTEIEKKWQAIWDQTRAFATTENHQQKIYVLDMFPYPSGEGLHVGHLVGYTATDVVARFKRLCGFDVLHPMGWDAFGLPAEQYAINTGNNPYVFNKKNIQNFKRQIKAMGFSYDWDKEIDTTDQLYYAQTQEIFRLLYKHNLATLKEMPVNWCPGLRTVLSNEEVLIDENGMKVSERGSFPVFQKEMKQWVLLITKYADKLLEGLKEIEFSDSIKLLQTNWIGKTEGVVIEFENNQNSQKISVFLPKPSQLNGAQAIFLNMFDEGVKKIVQESDPLLFENLKNSDTQINNKTGFSDSCFVLGKASNKQLSIEVPLLVGYKEKDEFNTGVLLIKPATNPGDNLFWEQRNSFKNWSQEFEISPVSLDQNTDVCALTSCKEEIKYKMRDWIFSRQRYWGEPFPVLYKGDEIRIDENPVVLPLMDKIQPTEDGKSPLANNHQWVNVEFENQTWQRDTNTMPNWAGSSWYHLAYILKNADGSYEKLDSQEAKRRFKKWLPVDFYLGGQEHAVLHLLFARFWHRFLYDIGIVTTTEPFIKLVNQGMILGNDGQKMSKSRGNVLNPDQLVEDLGADTIRVYEMFMGPITQTKNWSEDSILSIRKWLNKVWELTQRVVEGKVLVDPNLDNPQQTSLWQQTIKEVTELIEDLKFNVAISKFMVFFREMAKWESIQSIEMIKDIFVMFSLFAPHISEEVLENLNQKQIKDQSWPTYENSKILESNTKTYVVQVNGKLRATMEVGLDVEKDEILREAANLPNVKKFLDKYENITNVVFEDKVINFVCK